MAALLPEMHRVIPNQRIAHDSSTDLVAPEERLQAWHSRLQFGWRQEAVCNADEVRDLSWDMSIHHFGQLIATSARLSPQRIIRDTSTNVLLGPANALHLTLIESGSVHTHSHERSGRVDSGSLVLTDQLRDWELVMEQPCQLISWKIPGSICAHQDLESLHAYVLPASSPLTQVLAAQMRNLMSHSADLSQGEAQLLGDANVAFLSQALPTLIGSTHSTFNSNSLGQICRHIEQNLARPELGPDYLCRRFGLSRTALYRQFMALGGIASFIRNRRLEKARIQLLDPRYKHLKVAQIARNHGLNPQTFSRSFHAAFGSSPRLIRQAPDVRQLQTLAHSSEIPAYLHWLNAV
jgi:AraC-like DNA-binding protein